MAVANNPDPETVGDSAIIADTSGLLALFNRREPSHDLVANYLEEHRSPLVVSPYVLAELDYLIATRLGVSAELSILHELASDAYELASFGVSDLAAATSVIEAYRDQEVGLADASIVVLAARYQTRDLLTLDRRHFSVLRPTQGGAFRLIPDS